MKAVMRDRAGRPRRTTEGFTLLEVVVALVIFAVGVLAIIDLFSGSLRLSEGARDVSAAQVGPEARSRERGVRGEVPVGNEDDLGTFRGGKTVPGGADPGDHTVGRRRAGAFRGPCG
jgi:prepilin-type N-terminal cleavage/methylation domain-containing protein